MTFTPAGGVISVDAATFSLTPQGTGNLILVEVLNVGVGVTVAATALSSSNVTWTAMGAPYTGVTIGGTCQVFAGTVTSTSTATVTITFSGSAAEIRGGGQEFASTIGGWMLDVQGHLDNLDGSSAWASLTPSAAGELYFGYAYNANVATGGSTPGYVYLDDIHDNGLAYCADCTAAAQAPVWGDADQQLGVMVIVGEATTSSAALGVLGPYLYPPITSSSGSNTFVNNNVWNGSAAPGWSQTVEAISPGRWQVTANISTASGGAVVSYPDTQQLYAERPLATWTGITSSWSEAMNVTAGSQCEAAYDIWLNNFGNEVMIWVDTTASQAAALNADTNLGNVTLGGHTFTVYHRPSSTEYIYYLPGSLPAGTVDVLAVLLHAQANGYIPAGSNLTTIEFGWEIVTTNSLPQTFVMSGFSITETSAGPQQGTASATLALSASATISNALTGSVTIVNDL